MAELKSLAKDTAIYGASSIIGKFLNYFLVPIYTFSLPAASGGYGVITKMYAIVALLLVVLTFGMETGFFRFANKGDDDPKKVYSVSLLMVGDICLFSDADIVYEDGYEAAVLAEFERNPRADMIIFNIEVEEERRTYHITERKPVHWYNCGRYGAVSFAVRRESLLQSGITFSLLFGGGAKYSNGEDSLFLTEFIKKGYRVYTAPVTIGREEAGESTWFHGYNEKFFHDRGVLYHYLYGWLEWPLALRFLYAHKGMLCTEVSLQQARQWMRDGIREAGGR